MAALRNPQSGCPWDLEQTFSSIVPYTIEEAYEVADAIERDDMDDLRLELGDLLLQSVYHSRLAQEGGHFDFGDVVEGITAKMIRRHPHVFGNEDSSDDKYSASGMAKSTWERIKSEEAQETDQRRVKQGLPLKVKGQSMLDKVPSNVPALVEAEKLQNRAADVGFDWDDPIKVLEKVREELDELEAEINAADGAKIQGELGDIFFAVVNLARHLKVNPDSALRSTNRKFRMRFFAVEVAAKKAEKSLRDCSLDEMEAWWQEAKKPNF